MKNPSLLFVFYSFYLLFWKTFMKPCHVLSMFLTFLGFEALRSYMFYSYTKTCTVVEIEGKAVAKISWSGGVKSNSVTRCWIYSLCNVSDCLSWSFVYHPALKQSVRQILSSYSLQLHSELIQNSLVDYANCRLNKMFCNVLHLVRNLHQDIENVGGGLC